MALCIKSARRMIAVGLYILALWSTEINAERRNLSVIRYHFTPCGAIGTLGPVYGECLQYYASFDSPIIRDGVLTDTYSEFAGSQSFRPPRDTTWNVTIAGAAGGRGLCNIEYGHGLVQYLESVPFSTEYDYIILAGQRGLGPCATKNPDPGHGLCDNPPQTYEEASTCYETFIQWTGNLSATSGKAIKLFGGGAGGGGASYVGDRGRHFTGRFDSIIGISGGGGGSSVAFKCDVIYDGNIYKVITKLLNESLSDLELYKAYIDAKPTPDDFLTELYIGGRGYKVTNDEAKAGAGGGFSESLDTQISLEDGRGLNMSTNFAKGGTHCTRSDDSVPDQLREAVGGFGAGGGGCAEGGGGGGFTGGAVVNITQYTPGSGGYSFNNLSDSTYNKGDGYVDIVAADCGCVYECVVYEEEDQFECLCPNYTQLAPDLSDCYHSDERRLNVTSIKATEPNSDIILKGISFGNSSFIFSVDVGLSTDEFTSVKRNAVMTEDDGDLCVLMFVGEDNNIALVTNPIRGSGRAASLSRVSDNDTLTLTGSTSLLDSSVLVTGAVLASTAVCTIEEIIAFNISIQEIESIPGEVNFTKLATELYNTSGATNILLRQLLQLPDLEDETSETTGLSAGITAAIVIAVAVAVGIVVAVAVLVVVFVKRPSKSTESVVKFQQDTETDKQYNTYNQYREELQSNPGYEILDFGDNDGVHETVPRSKQFTPKYGVQATIFDFTDFNKSRSNTGINYWGYPRSQLTFMRDLGEGQFGKVMLMKAMNIAGYTGSIPVAVKTLSSRDPDVIHKFMEEAELMKRFTHPNIVSLLGVCDMNIDDDSAPLMILEYMPYGDLHGFLEAHRQIIILLYEGWRKISLKTVHFFCPSVSGLEEQPTSLVSENHFYNFAMDVAKGLEFLSLHKYVHRDIAARNCLVGANLQIKIADFGLARGVYDKDYYRVAGQTFLPVRWMAPECLLYGIFTTASDVWAYGVLLWEITSYGLIPLDDYDAQEIVDRAQAGSLHHSQPNACPTAMYSLMSKCHEQGQDERPSFSNLLQLLETANSSIITRTNSEKQDSYM